ncbi:MAG: hypothetical protein JWP92_3710 [Caulobacter sp.]|nr:hypothetical protein [Caulobacter sp.]
MSNTSLKPREFSHGWRLREWMAFRGKRQADMQRDLGWSKGKANEVYNGQPYSQALVDVLAPWLEIEPYELLMPPTTAMSIRNLKRTAAAIVAESTPGFAEPPEPTDPPKK